jgi:hypothetical protein
VLFSLLAGIVPSEFGLSYETAFLKPSRVDFCCASLHQVTLGCLSFGVLDQGFALPSFLSVVVCLLLFICSVAVDLIAPVMIRNAWFRNTWNVYLCNRAFVIQEQEP